MWSAGCVIAEMVTGKPLFAGKTQNDQLIEIIKVLGSISKEDITEINPKFTEMRMPEIKKLAWARILPESDADLFDLLDRIFTYSPSKRISPQAALSHPFFEDLRKEGFRMPGGRPLPSLFNWTEEELSSNIHLTLTPEWAKN
jgi:glycogen synthase kinase 3 beta